MTAHVHDRGYKKLFSNHTFFQQLLEEFVKEDWVKGLDFSTCERINKSFLSADYDQTASDVIYKVKLLGQDIYVIVITEFQSTVIKEMITIVDDIDELDQWLNRAMDTKSLGDLWKNVNDTE